MTDFTQTITNSVNMFGIAATNNWGVLVWGTDNWAEQDAGSDDLETSLDKLTFSPSTVETITMADGWTFAVAKLISEPMTIVEDLSSQTIQDSSGYKHNFASDTTEGEDRDFPTYAESSDPGTTQTEDSGPSSTWTAA